MNIEELRIGVNYFGRTIMAITPFKNVPGTGIVDYQDEKGEHRFSGLGEFLSWVNVQKGGEPTDTWHALMMQLRSKGLKTRRRIVKNGKSYRKRRGRLVEIPEEWVGKVTYPEKIRKRKRGKGRRFKRKAMR